MSAVAERIGSARVRRVVLEVGCLAAVVPDAMTFCFDVCTEGTALEGATLDIVRIPARGRCPECAREVDVTDLLGGCQCGSHVLDLVGGQELRIKEVEVI